MNISSGEPSPDTLDRLAHVPFDDALDALGHIQRRKLLFALLDHSPTDDSPVVPAGPGDDPLEGVAMDHVHLPKLAAYEFIDWNRDANAVTRGSKFDGISPLLELLTDNGDELPEGWL